MKYKQTYIPDTTSFDFKKGENRKNVLKLFYQKNFQGNSVKNNDTGIEILFTSEGIGKITGNRNIGESNAAALKVLDKMLKYAQYSNFGQRKSTDKQNVIGYLNFKAKVKIDGKLCHFRIAVKLKNDMKAYYNHTINRYAGDGI